MDLIINYTILLPAAAGVLFLLIPGRLKILKGLISLLISGFIFYSIFSRMNIIDGKGIYSLFQNNELLSPFFVFNIDSLSKLIILFIGFFGVILSIYSLGFVKNTPLFRGYWAKFMLTLSASFGVALADHLLTFCFFWGFLGITLYRFLRGDDEKSSAAAKKSFILIGATDSILIMGIGLLWVKTGIFSIADMNIQLTGYIAIIGFISLLLASFAKAGAFPVHTWVPDYTEAAPGPVSAFLPASLDKLLGIYFLARICMNIFVMNSWAKLLLLIIGSVTILSAVMMALIQHNYKRLLGYHAVSQVGYMVTGIGMGTPLGIAGGIFHMVNHALYKSGLFLTAGAVNKQTKESKLENLGGLAVAMPITFFAALVFALSISGVPPFNGFVSKWTIYQGLIDMGGGNTIVSKLWFIWLGAAVLGSALTLASFIKFISGIFLGKVKSELKKIKEVNFVMWIPFTLIAFLCIGFGIWGQSIIIEKLIKPITGPFEYIGSWPSGAVGVLIIAGILLGLILYFLGTLKNAKRKRQFVGGEILTKHKDMGFPSVEFYRTIENFPIIGFFYKKVKGRYFDIYDVSKKIILSISHLLSKAHTGILNSYIVWALFGLGSLMLFLFLVK